MVKRAAAWLLSAFAAAAALRAQSVDAWITGRVTDGRNGQPIAGAAITLTSETAAGNRTAQTGPRGWFAVTGLGPGRYNLQFSASGFQPAETRGLAIGVAARLEWNVRLVRAADVWLETSINTSRPAAVVPDPLLKIFGPDLDDVKSVQVVDPERGNESLDPSLSYAAQPQQLASLPITGRDAYTLLVTMPGFSTDAATALGLGLAASGQRPASGNFLLDGIENNQPFLAGPRTALPPEFLEEYRVSTNGFSAEFGRSGGFLANAVTRGAGDAWHGLAYVNLQHESLNANAFARNAAGTPRLRNRSAQTGITVGGPWRRRAGLTASLDRLRSRGEAGEIDVTLPSTNFGIFADPASHIAGLLRRFPASAVPSNFGPLGFVTLRPPVTFNRWTGLLRADWKGDRGFWFGRFAAVEADQPDRFWSPYPDFVASLDQPTRSAVVRYERVWSPRLRTETRFGWSRHNTRWNRPYPEVPTLVEALQGTVLPGSPLFYGFADQGTSIEAGHLSTLIREGHIIRAGGTVWLQHSNGVLTGGRDGQLVFENIQDVILDRPVLLRAAVDRNALPRLTTPRYDRAWRQQPFALFLQDSWKASRRFTLHGGLRYESLGAPYTERDLLLMPGEGASFSRARMQSVPAGSALWQPDRGSWQLRAGVAYSPTLNGAIVFRGGYGIFHDPLFGSLWQGVRNNGFLLASLTTGGQTGYNYLRPVTGQLADLSGQRFDDSFPSITAIDRSLRAPRIQSYFASVQWKARPGLTIDLHATGSTGQRLVTTDIRNRNRFANPSLPEVSWRGSQGFSQYWSGQAALRWQHRWGFLQAAHTWSRAIDNQSDPLEGEFFDLRFTQPGSGAIPRPRARFAIEGDNQADRGPADFDQRHGFVVLSSWTWRGFQWTQLAGFRSGLPYSVTAAGERADVRAPPFLDREGPGGRQLLDANAFAIPPQGRLGHTGRNAFRGPGLYSIDASMSRALRLTEGRRLILRLDAYNLLNHANLNNPVSELFAPGFGFAVYGRRGRETGFPAATPFTEQPRTLQILLRLEF